MKCETNVAQTNSEIYCSQLIANCLLDYIDSVWTKKEARCGARTRG
jgi:hypothetical protein